ncbi:CusA/CzcA family heavy metal efflux RND transporter [Saccharibacter sp. 17.LH.SD]|uniref:efflux RND transporter permease subunit n=1 Tax=Saccharibacter sp. 17.LH.SD TaxID=2689393 RepID=UPI001369F726|nr:CusA/CzcA family heavy metal efflux RND transporter [Saccharibacter sp. 17.LH.SD]MXV45200.1 CusA/CzcA family heavy metal efflux RND transporter [Saccharibacter sp. 17.LH.SD]
MHIERFIAWCFARRKLIFFLSVFIAVAGAFAWQQLPVEAYPDLGATSVQITTQMPGLAAEEMERQVTIPVERGLASVPGVVESRSSSTFGLSLITLIFREGMDVFLARQLVQTQLTTLQLTNGAQPSLGPLSGPSGEIYRYTLESDDQNLMALSDVQRWVVIPALQHVPGVVNIDNFGGFTREYQLILDPNALIRYGIGLSDVMNGIRNSNTNAGGGRVSRGEQSYIIRGVGQIHSLEEMNDIVVSHHDGVPVLLHELGHVEFGHQVREGMLGKNGNPDTIEGVVTMLRGENPSKVLDDLHVAVDKLQKRLAPMHMRIVPYIDRDVLVHATIDKVGETITEGIALVLIILSFFLGSPRGAAITAITIPFALAFAFILMRACGMAANLFSLGAVDFGVIVDGSIVITEVILRLREDNPTAPLESDTVLSVARRAGRAIFSSTLIIIVAYSPLFAFQGSEGKLFRPMAYTVSFALLGALLCALSLTPTLTFLALRKPRPIWHNKPLEWLHTHYERLLGHVIDRPRTTFTFAGAALIAVIALGISTGREFLPDLDEGALWLQIQMPTAISLEKGQEMASEIRRAVREFPETSYAITQLGRSDDGTDPWTPSHIEMPVGLTPYNQWPSGESKADFVARLRSRLSHIPGISFSISQPIQDNMSDLVGGAHSPLVMRIYGNDFHELRRIGQQIVNILWQVPGTVQAAIFQEPPIPQIEISTKRLRAARYGLNVSDISDVVNYAIGDSPLTTVIEDGRFYNATLRIDTTHRSNLEMLKQIPVATADGAAIPLGDVADIRLHMGESNIAHEMGERQITLQVDNGSRPMSQYLADAQKRIDQAVQFDHQNYRMEWAGSFQQAQEAQRRLIIALGVMFAVMLGLLYAEFQKLRQAVLILGIVPLATLGGLIALHLRNETLNIATAVGFIALFGVAIQNGIIMISSINRHRHEGHDVRTATIQGAAERFRPVLMTATVASAGMLPAALATGIGTDVQRGLATVVVGGLGIATLLTLFILPVFFCRMEERIERRAASAQEKGTP